MSVRVMEEARQQSLGEHIAETAGLEAGELKAIAALARQLNAPAILPVLGAGASYDCGVRVASEIGEDLLADYLTNGDYATHDTKLTKNDLAEITEAIFTKAGAERVVGDLGFPDPEQWRASEAIGDHFCVYSVLARMVREGFVKKSFGFNYVCGAEAGLETEGFLYEAAIEGKLWPDNARVVADAVSLQEVKGEGFLLVKAHGCAVRYRELAGQDAVKAAEGIIVRRAQLEDWKNPGWSRNSFRSSAENHVLLLIGFSGQDPKFAKELSEVLAEVYKESEANGEPRVVAIDLDPQTKPIEALVATGLDGKEAGEGKVTRVKTAGSSATAAMLVLLAELLGRYLEPELGAASLTLPAELEPRLTTLVISAPTMLRWSFLAQSPVEGGYMQRTNLMAQHGYVPLISHDEKVVGLIAARERLRERLGRSGPESASEALAGNGFVVDASQGVAYMPVGIDQESLEETCRQGDELEKIRRNLDHPNLDCILVSGDGSELRGVSLQTGEEAKRG